MKLAPCLAAALLLAVTGSAAAADRKRDDHEPRRFSLAYDVKIEHRLHLSGEIDHQLEVDLEGALVNVRFDQDGRLVSRGEAPRDPRQSEPTGWRLQWDFEGNPVEDCTFNRVHALQPALYRTAPADARQTALLFSPGRMLLAVTDCESATEIGRTYRQAGQELRSAIPVRFPIGKPGAISIDTTLSGERCPVEDAWPGARCEVRISGELFWAPMQDAEPDPQPADDADDGALVPEGPVKLQGTPKVDPKATKVEFRVVPIKGGTMRVMVFPEPPRKRGTPRARLAQDEAAVAQFVEIVTAGEAKKLTVPLDAQASAAIREAGGLRVQLDLFSAGDEQSRQTFHLDL